MTRRTVGGDERMSNAEMTNISECSSDEAMQISNNDSDLVIPLSLGIRHS